MVSTPGEAATPSDWVRSEVDHWLAEFEARWHEGLITTWAARLSAASTWRASALVELIRVDLRRHWREGQPVLLESYLELFPELGSIDDLPAVLLEAEFRARREAGEPVEPDDYALRFPVQIDELRRLVDTGATLFSDGVTIDRAASTVFQGPDQEWRSGANRPTTKVGRYHLLHRLGKGGMGSVYLAEDVELKRKVAVKISDLAGGDEAARRFAREARALAAIEHSHICPVYDYGMSEGVPYLAMAWIQGKPLSDCITEGGLPEREAAAIVRTIAAAMQVAHDCGIVHRDLKPSNIMMRSGRQGAEPVVVDFGLATRNDPTEEALSVAGQPLGTYHYMPLEQMRGDLDAHRPTCDVYALGVILYELITGRRPFEAASILSFVQLKEKHLPEPLSAIRPGTAPALEAICLTAMAREPGDRYPSMAALAEALDAYLESRPIKSPVRIIKSRRPPRRWKRGFFALAGICALIAVVALMMPVWLPVDRTPVPNAPPSARAESVSAAEGGAAAGASPKTLTNDIGMTLVLVPEGSYERGSGGRAMRAAAEGEPRFRVKLTRPFYLSATEVTQRQYQEVMGHNPSLFRGVDDRPVEQVSWHHAVAFCNRLSDREGLRRYYQFGPGAESGGDGYRLPTEAEWEYAALAGSTGEFCCGSDEQCVEGYAWSVFDDLTSTHPVGRKLPNAFGLYDMHGNVWEWCWDYFDAAYYEHAPAEDPPGPDVGRGRLVHGGGYRDGPRGLRVSARNWERAGKQRSTIGFRVARSLATTPPERRGANPLPAH